MCSHGLSAFLCSGFFGEPDSFSMYGSNRVKRRPSPYEMEITDGERISPLRRLLEGEGGGGSICRGGQVPAQCHTLGLNPQIIKGLNPQTLKRE